ncbi:murein transglycosylase domain-containing protein [Sulfurimonas sp. NWX79]|uniref:murein transglycosylase domain-containing protein n=1 Tax=Sulfurimonas sp. NWX79 TaxID=2925412 RepID=UPI003204B332
MFKTFVASALLISCASAISSFDSYKKSQKSNFTQEKSQFSDYKKAQQKAFSSYIKELEKYWKKPIMTSKKKLVSYAKDKKSRTIIDFGHNRLTIETLAKETQEAEQKLSLALVQAVTFNTEDFYNNDEFEQQLAKIEASHKIATPKIDAEPVLAPIFFKEQPTKKSLYHFVKHNITPEKIQIQKSSKIKTDKVYTLTISLPKDATIKRSFIYYEDVKREATRQQIPLALVFAIIHSESSFNPMARSYVPAYGLMQIVPRTAGIDAYYHLYKKKRLVGSSYLYNSKNNIKMGSAYLHVLYYKYLHHIKNPTSRLYCTIAAYNTGAGNVARAFVGTNDTYRAAQMINRLTPEEVYTRLLKDLRYSEAKRYLMKVRKRMKLYKKIYES